MNPVDVVQQASSAPQIAGPWWAAFALAILASGTASLVTIIKALRLRSASDKRLAVLERALGITTGQDGKASATVLDELREGVDRLEHRRSAAPASTRGIGPLRDMLEEHGEAVAELAARVAQQEAATEQLRDDMRAIGERIAAVDNNVGGRVEVLTDLVTQLVAKPARGRPPK